uniref:Secreted protein n=1 Tax=Ixodes ricinus TaxID=34613 RepID=A0A6B0V3V3_IXORI
MPFTCLSLSAWVIRVGKLCKLCLASSLPREQVLCAKITSALAHQSFRCSASFGLGSCHVLRLPGKPSGARSRWPCGSGGPRRSGGRWRLPGSFPWTSGRGRCSGAPGVPGRRRSRQPRRRPAAAAAGSRATRRARPTGIGCSGRRTPGPAGRSPPTRGPPLGFGRATTSPPSTRSKGAPVYRTKSAESSETSLGYLLATWIGLSSIEFSLGVSRTGRG